MRLLGAVSPPAPSADAGMIAGTPMDAAAKAPVRRKLRRVRQLAGFDVFALDFISLDICSTIGTSTVILINAGAAIGALHASRSDFVSFNETLIGLIKRCTILVFVELCRTSFTPNDGDDHGRNNGDEYDQKAHAEQSKKGGSPNGRGHEYPEEGKGYSQYTHCKDWNQHQKPNRTIPLSRGLTHRFTKISRVDRARYGPARWHQPVRLTRGRLLHQVLAMFAHD